MAQLTGKTQRLSLVLLTIFYFLAGINHFRTPDFYYPLIPNYLGNKLLINQLSGIAEMVLAIALLVKPLRRFAAYGIVVLLLAFLPAHIWMIEKGGCFAPNSFCLPVWLMWVRLLVLQPILIWWAFSVAKSAKSLAIKPQ